MRLLPLVAVLVAVSPTAAWGWTGAVQLTGNAESTAYPTVAVAPDGRATAIFSKSATPTDATTWRMHQAERPAGGSWTVDPNPISTSQVLTPEALFPEDRVDLAIGPTGRTIATWSAFVGGTTELWAATRGGGSGRLIDPLVMSGGIVCPNDASKRDSAPFGPTAVVGSGGAGHILWEGRCEPRNMAFGRPFTADGFPPLPGIVIRRIFKEGLGTHQTGAPTPDGRTRVMYRYDGETGYGRLVADTLEGSNVLTAQRRDDFQVGDPLNNGVTAGAHDPQITVLPDGKEVAAWLDTSVDPPRIKVSVTGQPTQSLNGAGGDAIAPEIASGADGTVVVAWLEDDQLWAAVRPPGEPFGPAHELSEAGEPRSLSLAVAPNGVAYAVWRRDGGDYMVLEGSIMDPLDPSVSPGTPFQFQPVASTLVDAEQGGTVTTDVVFADLAVSPQNVATVLFTFVRDINPPQKYAVGSLTHVGRAPGTVPPVVDPGGGGGGGGGGDTAPPPGDPAPPPGPFAPLSPAPDTRAPTIGPTVLSRQVFGVGKHDKVLARRGVDTRGRRDIRSPLRGGTKLSYTLDEPAKVSITVRHLGCWTVHTIGRKDDVHGEDGLCDRKAPKEGVVERITRTGKIGRNTVVYTGQQARKALRAGAVYRFEILATDAAGNRSRVKRSRIFKIDAAKRR